MLNDMLNQTVKPILNDSLNTLFNA